MELDKLLVKIEADLSDLKRGLDKANNEVKKSSSKMSNSMQRFGSTLDNVGGRVLKFGGLIAGAFGAYQIKQVVDVGRQIEDLQVRLKALFGTAEEGSRAFDVMVKFASKVPFTLNDIQQASGNLAVVAKDANELSEILEITGNVAGATGLSFTQTAEQIQRAFSGGIASADVFRERGVRNMLRFQAGAEVSVNETVKRFKEVFGRGGEFGNVTADLANTLTGTLSMLEDKLFQFRKAVADEFVVELKAQLGDLNTALEDSQEEIIAFGKEVGEGLATLTSAVVENFETIKVAITALGTFFLSSALYKIITSKGFAGLTALIIFINEYQKAEKTLEEQFNKTNESLEEQNKKINVGTKEFFEALETARNYNIIQEKLAENIKKTEEAIKFTIVTQGQLKDITEEVNKTFEDAGEQISKAFGDSIAKGEDFGDAMKKIFQDVASQIISTIAQILIIKPLIDSLTASLSEYQAKQKGGIGASLGGGLGSIVSSVGSFLGFANGGYTPPNKPYMVGERGAELFVPKTAGNIVPNNELGGGINVVQNISFSTGVVPTVRAEVLNLLPTIKQETINAVAEQRSRGGAFARTFGA
jgi:hypothetical protein